MVDLRRSLLPCYITTSQKQAAKQASQTTAMLLVVEQNHEITRCDNNNSSLSWEFAKFVYKLWPAPTSAAPVKQPSDYGGTPFVTG